MFLSGSLNLDPQAIQHITEIGVIVASKHSGEFPIDVSK
jgi:hypothetical protein